MTFDRRSGWIALALGLALITSAPASAQEVLSPRLMIALDTSGSMVRQLGAPLAPWTFGDGSLQNCTFTAAGGGHWCGPGCTAGIDGPDGLDLTS